MRKFKNSKYYVVVRKQADVKVKSGIEDSSEDEILHDKKLHKPKALRQLKILQQINARIRANIQRCNDGNAEQEINELHEIEIMQKQLRHCRSFKQMRPTTNQIWGSDSDTEKF